MSDVSAPYTFSRQLVAELVGTAILLATVVGSGIMAENLAGGNVAIALLGNTLPTGAILVVLITMLGPISGAHFNPAVSLVFFLKKTIAVQLFGLVHRCSDCWRHCRRVGRSPDVRPRFVSIQ